MTAEKILFIDIETVSEFETVEQLDERWYALWKKKAETLFGDIPVDLAYSKAALVPEFGKIVCISVGYLKAGKWSSKSFFSDNEKNLLEDFKELLNKFPTYKLAGHYAKGFDFPYICKRMLKHHIEIPASLDIKGKKPWEITLIDTKEMWQFGDWKNSTSLDLLTAFFGIESPKDAMDGSMVHDVYYKDQNLTKISLYCEKDVLACAQVYCAMSNLPIPTIL